MIFLSQGWWCHGAGMGLCLQEVPHTAVVAKQILRDCSGLINPGALTGLLGQSGAGKTTLLNILASRKNCTSLHVAHCTSLTAHMLECMYGKALLLSWSLIQHSDFPSHLRAALLVWRGVDNLANSYGPLSRQIAVKLRFCRFLHGLLDGVKTSVGETTSFWLTSPIISLQGSERSTDFQGQVCCIILSHIFSFSDCVDGQINGDVYLNDQRQSSKRASRLLSYLPQSIEVGA